MKRVLSINHHHQDPAIGREKRLKTPISDQNLRGNYLQQKPNAEYTVGWICAATTEYVAARAILDEKHVGPEKVSQANQSDFTLGRIGKHNVVIATLPLGEYGTASAATVAADMSHNFPNIRIRLMVGVGGGAPSERNDIRLGDIVVSAPSNGKSGVFQYDYGRTIQGQPFQPTRFLDQSPMILRTAMAGLMVQYACEGHQLEETIKIALERSPKLLGKYSRPHESSDRLYCNTFVHPSNDGSDCAKSCGDDSLIMRPRRTQENSSLVIHYGMIASANQLMKNAIIRDKMSSEYHVLCFEKEAGGLMNTFPCLVIRGICDYSDSHTNEIWQGYAAMAAAAYAKDLINRLPPLESAALQSTINSASSQLPLQEKMPYTISVEQMNALLDSLRFDQIEARQMTIKNAHAKTCRWLLHKYEYINWLDPAKISEHRGFLWIKGKPGTGKSTLMKFALSTAKKTMRDKTIISFFFNARGDDLEKSTIGMYRSLLLQLFEKLPELRNTLELPKLTARPSEEYRWTEEILTNLLDQAIQNLKESSIVCFIDALNECDENQIRKMIKFFERVGESPTAGNFRVCFSSRHYPHASISKGLNLILEGQEGHTQDMISYVDSELKIGRSALANQIRAELQEKASGVFMWVVLVVNILNKEHDKGRSHVLKKRLQEIPADLYELFRDILTRDRQDGDELLLCIQWVLFTKEPLRPEQLYFAMLSNVLYEWNPNEITASDIEKFILNSSKGLMEVTKSRTPTVQFIHESVKDYLLKENGLRDIWPNFQVNVHGDSHERLKQCCLNYIAIGNTFYREMSVISAKATPEEAKRQRQLANTSFPFLEYAVRNVLHHANEAAAGGANQAEFLKLFPLNDWVQLDNFLERYESRRHKRNVSFLYILAELNMSHLIKRNPDILSFLRIEPERYGTPLFAALAMNSSESLQAFLDAYLEIEPSFRDIIEDYYSDGIERNSLGRSFKFSRTHCFTDFVTKGATLSAAFYLKMAGNIVDLNSHARKDLIVAVANGHKSILKLFLDKGADVDYPELLSVAISNGHEAIADFLLDNGAKIDPTTKSGRTFLSIAAEKGLYSLVERSVNGGVEVDVQNEQGQEIELDDDATDYSDLSSIGLDMRENYISGLVEFLSNMVKGLEPDKNTRKRVREVLPDLLEAFALKIGYNAPNQSHRDVMVFVHKYRQKISTSFQERYFETENVLDKLRAASSYSKLTFNDAVRTWLENLDHEQLEPGSDESKISKYDHQNYENSINNKNQWTNEKTDSTDGRTDSIDRRTNSTNGMYGSSDSGIGSVNGGPDSTEGNGGKEETEVMQEPTKPWHIAYHDFIPKTEAYEWLLNRLRREFHLAPATPSIMDTLRLKITKSLQPIRRVSRRASSKTYKVIFEVDWDVLAFIEKQQYDTSPAGAIERAITLTGSYQDSYVSTCGQYINQAWPLTGGVIMQLVKDMVESSHNSIHTCSLSDGTKLSARINEAKFIVEACGVIVSIADVGEQLAWFGAALRLSPHDQGPVCCSPFIDITHNSNVPPDDQLPPDPDIIYKIGFSFEDQQHPNILNGLCWHNLFMNPTIVKGYPIPPRIESGTGAEIPLNIMAGLARTHRVDSFKGMICIKGFSILLVPKGRSGNTIFWHLIYNKDGRISYLAHTRAEVEHVNNLYLEQCRHIVGWCPEANFYAGSALADYTISGSSLPRPHEGCSLANTYVSPGRGIIGGPVFSLGARDTPFHISRGGYIHKLKWISTKLVLLWDESEKRGWLINGTSALLHIVRASLVHDSTDDFSSTFMFKEGDLQESARLFTTNSAIGVLINEKNLTLKIYPEKNGFILLKDRVEYFCNILEKLIDHQTDITEECGKNMADKPRRYLEGWDFNDLATSRDPLYPRVATLEPHGKVWIDLIRAAQVVTLFGCGFGELIKPSTADICEYWAEVPKQKYYIATGLSDLSGMLKDNENNHHHDNLVRLSENIIWHTPTTLFGSCRCKGILGQDHSEPVQALLPSSMSSKMLPRKITVPLNSPSAILFGHNSTFSWIYEDSGDPKEGKLSPPKVSDAHSPKDSGIELDMDSSKEVIDRSSPQRLIQGLINDKAEISPPDTAFLIGRKTFSREEYTVGIVCALSKELLAVRALFDERHQSHPNIPRDNNHYALGRIGKHMVAALCLPAGEYGIPPAASSTTNLTTSFPNIKFCLLVGIGGGAPSERNDIRLGDVVVSLPTANHPGVIQYDRGKQKENETFERTGTLQPPPWYLMTAISSLRSDPDLSHYPLQPYLEEIAKRLPESGYTHPGQKYDELYQIACLKCQIQEKCVSRDSHVAKRSQRLTNHPKIHYGLIASGNCLIKNSQTRDKWAREHNVLCFEMEAAGMMNLLPCLVIRGISDYADSFKNDLWQEYAAATAAAYMKLLLSEVAAPDKSHYTSDLKRQGVPESEATEQQSSKRRRLNEDSE